MAIQIRRATLRDLPQLTALFVQAITHTCQNDYNPQEIKVWTASAHKKERWATALKEQQFILAEEAEQLMGFASLKAFNYIDFMYVHPQHLRKGVASRLFNTLEAICVKQNQREISSDVSITARPFFERKGFELVHKNYNKVDAITLINYKMRKIL